MSDRRRPAPGVRVPPARSADAISANRAGSSVSSSRAIATASRMPRTSTGAGQRAAEQPRPVDQPGQLAQTDREHHGLHGGHQE